jgi:hypothetical protein
MTTCPLWLQGLHEMPAFFPCRFWRKARRAAIMARRGWECAQAIGHGLPALPPLIDGTKPAPNDLKTGKAGRRDRALQNVVAFLRQVMPLLWRAVE